MLSKHEGNLLVIKIGIRKNVRFVSSLQSDSRYVERAQ